MNVLESLIGILSTPIAKRKGVTISAEDCKIWIEELNEYEEHVRKELKEYYKLKMMGETKKMFDKLGDKEQVDVMNYLFSILK